MGKLEIETRKETEMKKTKVETELKLQNLKNSGKHKDKELAIQEKEAFFQLCHGFFCSPTF